MADPVSWAPDASGAVRVHFADGSSHLMPPDDPTVANVIASFPRQAPPQPSVGSDEYYAALSRENALKGQGMPVPAAPAPPAPPTADQYRVGGVGGASGTPAPSRETSPDYAHSGQAPPVYHGGVGPMRDESQQSVDPAARVMLNRPAQQGQASEGLPAVRIIPGTPGRVVPGGRSPQSWTTQTEQGLEIPEEAKALLGESEALTRSALQTEAQAAIDENRLKGEFSEREKGRELIEADQAKQRQVARDEQERLALERYDQAKIIDPQRLWNSKSDWDKFVATLNIGIHDFVDTWLRRGGENQALKRLQAEIDRDVQAQVQNLNTASADVQRLYGSWEREDARIAAGKASHNEAAAREFESWTADIKDARTRAAMDKVVAALDREAADQRIKAAQLEQGKKVVTQHDVQTKDQVVGGSPARVDTSGLVMRYLSQGGDPKALQEGAAAIKASTPGLSTDQAAAMYLGASLTGGGQGFGGGSGGGSRIQPGDPSTYVPGAFGGKGGFAVSAEAAKSANQTLELAHRFTQTTEELKRLRATPLSTVPGSKERNALTALSAQRFEIAKKIAETGASLTEAEIKNLVEPIVNSDALDLFSTDTRTLQRLDASQHVIDTMVDAKLKNAGIAPGTLQARGGRLQGTVQGAPQQVAQPGTARFRPAGQQ